MFKYTKIKPDGVFVIAEAGVNHNGDFENAKKLVLAAKEAGVDAVKFQTFKTENLVTIDAKKAEYQEKATEQGTQFDMLKKLELTYDEFRELKRFCDNENIKFLSTAFDLDSIEFLHSLGMDIWKIPSGEITNYPYIKKIAEYNEPIILSTGMADFDEIKVAKDLIKKYNDNELVILHCTTAYPTDFKDVNLKVMNKIKEEMGVNIGYSDHTIGIEVPIAATTLGATVIEKHFTLDKNMEGPDHSASLEPDELKEMVNSIRNIEIALGDGKKNISEIEKANKQDARKSIVAKTDIKKGEIFTENNLTIKRPGTGISPMNWNEIIGTEAKRDYKKDELI